MAVESHASRNSGERGALCMPPVLRTRPRRCLTSLENPPIRGDGAPVSAGCRPAIAGDAVRYGWMEAAVEEMDEGR